ncbi:MAG: UvrD-helicase domain-containing protein [Patescibacteria group bacterium]|nr:UvrD-helicase domain-containing protein [Patescibacteria group bacterium]
MNEELKKLNKEQLLAVKHDKGPLLVVAGAGTGKTTVLINRLAYLIMEKKLKTDEILLTTFTEKSANEMIERADKILPYGYVDLWIHTFHGFAERILRQYGLEIGLNPEFKLLDSTAQWVFLKKNLEKLNLKYYHSSGNPNKFIAELLSHFSRLKDENISSEDYQKLVDSLDKKMQKNSGREIDDIEEALELERLKELSNSYNVYNKLLIENNFLDFGDLINYTIKLFKTRPNISKILKDKFKYLMVDEFQDTNLAQYELIKLLAEGKNNLMVVGDDDQSIYKFRGASISNIMQFKDDFPNTKEIILSNNYRSRQEILDVAYKFIKNNDPNRLEVKLNINKKLKSRLKFSSKNPAVSAINFSIQSDELNFVSAKIMEIYEKEPETNWSDFAILSRTNNTADIFSKDLSRLNIPNHFVSLRGLYYKAIVLDIISYFKLLDNYKESSALFRVLNMEAFKISNIDLVNLNSFAKRNYWSLYEALENIDKVKGLSAESFPKINKLLSLIKNHSAFVGDKKPSFIFIKFIYDSEILKNLHHERDRETFSYINQFYQKIKKFEENGEDLRLKDFIEALEFELEAGDTGGLKNDFVDVDTVKVMTVHSAKGLEFKYVFLVDLVERRFPSDSRVEKISIHPALIKEKISENDNFHIEEERRLFYVALTRAKEGLFLTSAKDFGGAREKRPSAFIKEAGLDLEVVDKIDFSSLEFLKDLKVISEEKPKLEKKEDYQLPAHFSFSQFAAFDKCPLQYKYAHILKIPSSEDKPSLTFGRVIHDTLYNFLLPIIANNNMQADLFSSVKKEGDLKSKLSEKKLLELYKKFWQDEGYGSKQKRDEYWQKGLDLLKNFFNDLMSENLPEIYFLEKDFRFKFQDFLIKGKIDRVDKIGEGNFEIIDYKTGSGKDKLETDDKRQLVLYKMVAEASFGIKVDKLSYYYLENGQKLSFEAKDKDIEKMEEWLLDSVAEIRKKQFLPKPSSFTCDFCDFKGICEFRQ